MGTTFVVELYFSGLKVASKCPECGVVVKVDFDHTPMVFPVLGSVKHIKFSHPTDPGEGHAWSVPVVMGLTVRVATDEDY